MTFKFIGKIRNFRKEISAMPVNFVSREPDVISLLFNHTAVHAIPAMINSVSNMFALNYGFDPIVSIRYPKIYNLLLPKLNIFKCLLLSYCHKVA